MSSVSFVREREAGSIARSLAKLIERRDTEIEQVRQRYQSDIDALESALSVLNGTSSNGASMVPQRQQRSSRSRWISDEKLDAVRRYMQANSTVRQADIARDLELNSGSVSVALAILHATDDPRSPKQEVRALTPLRGSRQWEYVCRELRRAKGRQKAGRTAVAS